MDKIYVAHPYGNETPGKNKLAVETFISNFYTQKKFICTEDTESMLRAIQNQERQTLSDKVSAIQDIAAYKRIDTVLLSPIHTFGFLYDKMDYVEGVNLCLALLDTCDYLLLLGSWAFSKGCMTEFGYAKAKGIKILTESNVKNVP